MKIFSGVRILVLFTVFGLSHLPVGAREFTNNKGVKIDATIVKVVGPKVVIEGADAKEFKIKIESLSEADQKYIADWKKENISANFRYRFNKKRLQRKRSAGGKVESWAYEVVIHNSGLEDIGKLDVRYTLYRSLRDRYADKKNTVSKAGDGSASIESIKRGGSSTFMTRAATMNSNNSVTLSRTAYDEITRTSRKWDEDLAGVSLTIYHDGKLIATEEFGSTEASPTGRQIPGMNLYDNR